MTDARAQRFVTALRIALWVLPALLALFLIPKDDGLRHVGQECRKALRSFDLKALAAAIPDELVDEIGIACTPDEARDRLAEWKDLTEDPLFYPPSVGVAPERVMENLQTILDVFGSAT